MLYRAGRPLTDLQLMLNRENTQRGSTATIGSFRARYPRQFSHRYRKQGLDLNNRCGMSSTSFQFLPRRRELYWKLHVSGNPVNGLALCIEHAVHPDAVLEPFKATDTLIPIDPRYLSRHTMESIATAFAHLVGDYQFQTAVYVLYIYDHMLTFSEEVDKIWSQPFTFASLLFYLNRYVTHCQFIIIQVEFHETTWSESVSVFIHNLVARSYLLTSPNRCRRYVPFAGGATVSLVVVAELIMTLRIYALYLRNKFILAFLLLAISGQIIACGWGLRFSEPVPLPPGFPGCVLTGNSPWLGAIWAAPLVTDSCIFSLTLWRTIQYKRINGYSSTVQVILRDGTLYFALIFSGNLMNTLIYFTATEDLKAVGASFSQILTAIMIARLQLNLRQVKSQSDGPRDPGMVPSARHSSSDHGAARWRKRSAEESQQTESTFLSVGNLGGELRGTFFELESGDDLEKVEEVEEIELCDLRPIDMPQRAHIMDSEASSSQQNVLV